MCLNETKGKRRQYGGILGLQFPGLVSCVYMVSAVFRTACHPIGNLVPPVTMLEGPAFRWPFPCALRGSARQPHALPKLLG